MDIATAQARRLCMPGYATTTLLIIPEEYFNRQPRVTADLEAVWQTIQLLHLLISQTPAIKLEVGLNTASSNGLGNDRGVALKTPHEQNLCGSLALGLSKLNERLVLRERAVGAAKAGVSRGVDALLLAVLDELWGWVVGVELDLVDGWDGLAGGVVEEFLEVLDGKVGDADVLYAAGGGELLHFLPGLEEVPVLEVLLEVVWVGRGGPVDEVEVYVVHVEGLEGGCDALLDAVVPGHEELVADCWAELCFVPHHVLSSLVVTQISSRGTPESLIP
jgi:hypothetical protein